MTATAAPRTFTPLSGTDVTASSPPSVGTRGVVLLISLGAITRRVELPITGPVRIGRAADNQVVIDHPSVSRSHAELTFAPLTVRDLGSANGVVVRDRRIAPGDRVALATGEAVMLGDAVVLVREVSRAISAADARAPAALIDRLTRACTQAAAGGAPAPAILHVVLAGPISPARLLDDRADAPLDDRADAPELEILDRAPGLELVVRVPDGTSPDALAAQLHARAAALGVPARLGIAAAPLDGTIAEQLLASAHRRAHAPAPEPLRALIAQIAVTPLNVLITGDTGTGKELCAEQLHQASPRARGPLVRINCATLVESLIESELFGHERGAFTGAQAAKPGLFETADGGTLFLDEIGELPFALQAKLLRVLEDRRVQRLGGVSARVVDVRFIAATNRTLAAEVDAGRFRRDLFFRLAQVTVALPPLAGRRDDILGLAHAYLLRAAAAAGRPPPRLTAAAEHALADHPWPGNVRELRSLIERAVWLRPEPLLDADHLGLAPAPAPAPLTAPPPADPDAARLLDALHQCGGNQTRAARLLGISRNTLQARMDRHGIPRPRKD